MTTKIDKDKYEFCCMGVKAFIEGKLRTHNGQRISRDVLVYNIPDGSTTMLSGDPDLAGNEQAFLTELNDKVGLSFAQIAGVIEYARDHRVAFKDADYERSMAWLEALRSGEFKQGKNYLGQEIEPQEEWPHD